jgi:hypothetical protein
MAARCARFHLKRNLLRLPRKAIVPAWFVVGGLFAVLGPPMTLATSVVVLLLGTVAVTIGLTLWHMPEPTIAEMLNHVEPS